MAQRRQPAATQQQALQQQKLQEKMPPGIDPAVLAGAEEAVRRARAERSDWHDATAGDHGESERLRQVADLLGGPKVVGKYPADALAAHEMLQRGLPNTAIRHLLGGATMLAQKSIENAIGMSVRTRQRREKHPRELLSQDQTGRTWKFAEILTRAISVFGSRTAAEQWLAQPATGLDQRRPIELLTTPAGMELVEDFLGRVEYGVHT